MNHQSMTDRRSIEKARRFVCDNIAYVILESPPASPHQLKAKNAAAPAVDKIPPVVYRICWGQIAHAANDSAAAPLQGTRGACENRAALDTAYAGADIPPIFGKKAPLPSFDYLPLPLRKD